MNPALMMLMRARGAAPSSVQPSDFAGLSAWWKADAITGLADGGAVSTWNDSSGNGNNAGGSGDARPLYRTNQVNGLPAVDFDGTDDWLNASSAPTHGNEQTLLAVVRLDAIGSLMMIRGAVGGGGISMDVATTGALGLGISAQAHTVVSGTTMTTGTWYILTGSVSASNDWMRARVNGSQTQAAWTGTATTARGTRISNDTVNAAGKLNGQIAELISYQALRSDAEILALEDYLATKYGL